MDRKIFRAAILLTVIFFLASTDGAGQTAPAGEASQQEQKQVASSNPESVPEGWMLVEEDIWMDFSDEPGEKFDKALQNYLRKDYKATAAEIHKGASFVRLQSCRATKEGKEALMASVNELDNLSQDIKYGRAGSYERLEQAFAKAQYALAKHHYLKAGEYKTANNSLKVGHCLKAAAADLERGFTYAGHNPEAETTITIKDTCAAAEKLIEGTGEMGEETDKLMEKMAGEIERLGKLVEPKVYEPSISQSEQED